MEDVPVILGLKTAGGLGQLPAEDHRSQPHILHGTAIGLPID